MKYGEIYSFNTIEDAKKLIGKTVVFSDSLGRITKHPELCKKSKLQGVSTDGGCFEEANYFLSEDRFYYQFIRDMEVGDPPTPQEFAEKMKSLAVSNDTENRHSDMDALMCETLRTLGYEEGVEIFENTDKWYA